MQPFPTEEAAMPDRAQRLATLAIALLFDLGAATSYVKGTVKAGR